MKLLKKPAFILIFILLFFSCKHERQGTNPLFTLLPPSSTNIDFINKLTETEQSNMIEYLYFNNGGGVAAGDINNDGLVDICFTSNQNSNKLYLNKGNLKFEDITEASGLSGKGSWKTGVTMADINGDGYLDIYVCQVGRYKEMHGRNQLFINHGDLTFSDEADEYGLDFSGFSTQSAFFDYDQDGDLDMYLLNHSVHSNRSYGESSLRLQVDSLAGDRLYRNDELNGKRVFHDVTLQSGIYSSQIGYGLGISISDVNNDAIPDIYISNDFHENDYLYIGNGNGTFSEKLTDYIAHTSRSSMGNDAADINNDGLMDIVVLDMLPDDEKISKQSGGEDDYELYELKLKYGYNHQYVRNTLQLNMGDGMFSEIGALAGISATDWSWSPLFCDVDNDGWKDLFVTSGIYRRANDLDYVKYLTGGNRMFPTKDNSKSADKTLYEKMPLYENLNYIFRNNGDLTFNNMAKEWGFDKRAFSNGSAYADLDNDGDLDLVVNNINSPAFLYRNNSTGTAENHFISIALKGAPLNNRGIGTRVTLYSNGMRQVAEQYSTRGFLSSTTGNLHFGLGKSVRVDSILVRWPDKSQHKLTDIHADTIITIEIKNTSAKAEDMHESQKKLFTPASIPGLDYKHVEDEWVDFYREKLIPHSFSAEGPSLASGDVNGDGLDDIFAGGSKGHPGVQFTQQKDGSFKSARLPLHSFECSADQVDASFFDADGDGDQDLYIASGGNELLIGDPMLSDHLMINDGKGNFSKGILPFFSHNASCVRPCDFDSDGDIDLFVGSRSVPGSYGISPEQFLLENDGHGHFNNVTDLKAPALKFCGMVTDAAWFDSDNDGDMDLAISGEWMKVTIYNNNKSNFSDVTSAAGLEHSSGLWNCLRSADVDGDGDVDLIGGNLGLNTLFKASVTEPVELYLNDYDNNGSVDPVICTYWNGKSYPYASVDELSGQITGLSSRFPSYSDFGYKSMSDIFGSTAIQHSTIKNAILFESCLFLNNGKGIFETVKLPVQSQFSVVRDVISGDINNDGDPDLLVAGNNYAVRPSYGRYDASPGWCLINDGNLFKTILPWESGLRIDGDARKIIRIEIKGKHFLVVAINSGKLQIFEEK